LTSYAWLNWFEALKLGSFLFVLFSTYMVFSDVLPRSWAHHSPTSLLRVAARPAGAFLLFLSPLLLTICRLVKLAAPQTKFSSYGEPQEQLADFLSGGAVNAHDKRLLLSVINFKKRIVREIMQPRVDLFCISEDLTLKESAELLHREGYSRVPLYRGTVDTVVGILFYKDFLAKYVEANQAGPEREHMLSTPVKNLMKKVLYCPETKKISSLLQEFRKRKTHLAVVVDEYGGTAGLVTIEDILEEIVGEIADEYDEQDSLFKPAPDEGWIVDAKMNLLDIQEELGITIPQEETYDTLAGYIVYRVGSIPQPGLILHHDQFNIEILKSNDRMVEEVKITPLFPSSSEEHDESNPS
jgi:CBS domain containing-hemolysin-like protein